MANKGGWKRHKFSLTFAFAILLFLAVCSRWLWQAKRQFALDRQLITARGQNNSAQALALVIAGADPNTHIDPTPSPTLAALLQRLLCHQPPPVDYSPTAFLLACGIERRESFPEDTVLKESSEDLALLKAMIGHGANISATIAPTDTESGRTAFMAAVDLDHPRAAEILLAHGADVNAWYDPYDSPLLVAAEHQNDIMVLLLLAHGADVHQVDYHGRTSLHTMVMYSLEASTLKLLLRHGVDPSRRDSFGRTALWYAHRMKSEDVIALLKQKE